MKSSEQIRQEFLDFFESKQHQIVPSAPLVPQNDPTLLFVNAGMNQFKDVFLGTGDRPYKRATDTQKCLRVSGKHNDLEEVGYDTYHHTFFEMLGNWSFGDYFKKEAIEWSWELLVDQWGLSPDRLYVTVHEGDEKLGLKPDEEAVDLWKKLTNIDHDHILYCDSKDNFWMMGDTGPCGPCSEIHVDMRTDAERAEVSGRDMVNMDHPHVIEIWNLVFIQYNAQTDGSLKKLAAQHVDTGMGFERIVAVIQGKKSNYDSDLFRPLLNKVAGLSPVKAIKSYEEIDLADEAAEKARIALRVIADHVRTVAFAITDGAAPANVGRGYVIRRILRRAIRYAYQTLEFRKPFMAGLVEPLIEKMGGNFPELEKNKVYIKNVLEAEEKSFLGTLASGIALFERVVPYVLRLRAGDSIESLAADLKSDNKTQELLGKAFAAKPKKEIMQSFLSNTTGQIPGELAFLLHDTYGFPIDLTALMAREKGLSVNQVRYQELMDEQKNRAREAASFAVDMSGAGGDQKKLDPTEFYGYDVTSGLGEIISHRTIEDKKGKKIYQIVLDKTPFYAESGGQVGDSGIFEVAGEEIQVLDTKKTNDVFYHTVNKLPESLTGSVTATVDAGRRNKIIKHHSVTHLLQSALREVLGPHVKQQGSLVNEHHLRFDFSHFEKVNDDQLRTIERRVNEVIQQNIIKQEDRNVPVAEAMDRGATALFGEKYGNEVRIITFDKDYSMELCGGVHVDATGEIGLFRFTSEGSIASGVRRVEAVAGGQAIQFIQQEMMELERTRSNFRTLSRPVDEEVADLIAHAKKMDKAVANLREAALTSQLDSIVNSAEMVGDVKVATGLLDGADMKTLQNLGQTLRDKLGAGSVAAIGSSAGGKAFIVTSVSDDLIKKGIKAGAIVGQLAKIVGGGGGGRPQLAGAGGKKPENLNEALKALPNVVAEMNN